VKTAKRHQSINGEMTAMQYENERKQSMRKYEEK